MGVGVDGGSGVEGKCRRGFKVEKDPPFLAIELSRRIETTAKEINTYRYLHDPFLHNDIISPHPLDTIVRGKKGESRCGYGGVFIILG